MSTTVRSARSGIAWVVAGLMLAAGAATAQQPIIIDAETGEPLQISGLSGGAMATLQSGGTVSAATPGGQVVLRGEVYKPGIWTDPDGCQHWVMDDGVEGYMAPILTRYGKPVCHGGPSGHHEQIVIRKYDVPYHGKGHVPSHRGTPGYDKGGFGH